MQLLRYAKSDIWWGNSCKNVERIVVRPKPLSTKNEAPKAIPSVKLWIKSLKINRVAFYLFWLLQQFVQLNIDIIISSNHTESIPSKIANDSF